MFGRSILASVILLGLYAGVAQPAGAEAIQFPDPALEAIVRKHVVFKESR